MDRVKRGGFLERRSVAHAGDRDQFALVQFLEHLPGNPLAEQV